MIGFVSDREARIWVRLSGPHQVQVRYAPAAAGRTSRERISRPVRALARRDHTAVIPLMRLEPDTAYRYTVLIDGKKAPGEAKQENGPVFRTLPPANQPGKFRVAFGSCASVDFDPVQPIWKAVARTRPQAFLWIGDNVYADTQDSEVFRKKYRRQRMVKNLLPFQASVPQLAVWDDHDYGLNDGDRTFPAKKRSLAVFREYWANPQYGLPGRPGVQQTPGVFFRWSIGNVDLFLLDARTFRDPDSLPDGPRKTHLGIRQKDWLKASLKRSRAVFKVLVAPGAWTESKGPGGDSWASFLDERNEIFDFIQKEGVTGVFLLAGDSHRPQVNVIPWSEHGGYDLYEVISSPLAQKVKRKPLGNGNFRHLRPPNAYTLNFGFLEFDTQAEPARVKIRLMDAEGKDLWTPLSLTADDLKPGVKSWNRILRE
ncbi:MAG: alkaline phosphatase D family protein [Nitrospinota bacterium]